MSLALEIPEPPSDKPGTSVPNFLLLPKCPNSQATVTTSFRQPFLAHRDRVNIVFAMLAWIPQEKPGVSPWPSHRGELGNAGLNFCRWIRAATSNYLSLHYNCTILKATTAVLEKERTVFSYLKNNGKRSSGPGSEWGRIACCSPAYISEALERVGYQANSSIIVFTSRWKIHVARSLPFPLEKGTVLAP